MCCKRFFQVIGKIFPNCLIVFRAMSDKRCYSAGTLESHRMTYRNLGIHNGTIARMLGPMDTGKTTPLERKATCCVNETTKRLFDIHDLLVMTRDKRRIENDRRNYEVP